MKNYSIAISGLQSRKFSNIEKSYTFEAEGTNIDYMLLVALDDNGASTKSSKIVINKLHDDIFEEIREAYENSDFGDDGLRIVNYLRDSGIVDISSSIRQQAKTNFFNYCIKLSDRHQPEIDIDIKNNLDMYYSKISQANTFYKNDYFYQSEKGKTEFKDTDDDLISIEHRSQIMKNADESLKKLRESLNKDLCTYIILWLHAYRFLKARQAVSAKKENILYSHKYRGWSQPRYRLDQDLEIEFNTNFGYGRSSYFHLIIIYKNIHLVNFIDWIDYRIKGVSQIKKYTRRYQRSIVKAGTENEFINDDNWEEAIEEANLMCETYLNDYSEFIKEFVLNSLEDMISGLEEIIDINIVSGEFNKKHRIFEETFESKLYKNSSPMIANSVVMSVKGSKISGALELISNILELDDLFSIEQHILKIKNLNIRLYPLIVKEINDVPKLIAKTKREIDRTIEELKELPLKIDGSENSASDRRRGLLLDENKTLNNDLRILIKLKNDMSSYAKDINKYLDLQTVT